MKAYSIATTAALVFGSVLGNAAGAVDAAAPAAATAPAFGDLLTNSGITATGYVASSYYHSNGYSTFHQFDLQHDTFQLDQAALAIAYQPKEGFGAVLNIASGEDMKVLNAAEGSNSTAFDVVQGFVQYAGGPLTVIAGKYVTLVGAEVIAPTGNTNFSRSLLFYAEPLTHTGVRATYAASDTLNLVLGVNNGWNTVSTSYGSKTAELGMAYAPNKTFAVTAQALIGKVPGYDAPKTIVDVVGTYNATETLSFLLSFDWGKQEQRGGLPSQDWNGIAAYANYAISDQWRLSVRAEYLHDKAGLAALTGTAQKLKEGTVTVGYAPVKSFELRMEVRYDKSDQQTFLHSLDESASALRDNQTGFAVQGLYKF